MGHTVHHDRRETGKLKLSQEYFPFSKPLLALAMQRYANPDKSAAPGQEMELAELIVYLRNATDSKKPPLEAVLAQTEEIGDPALPTAEQVAILAWLGVSWESWQSQYSLEGPLAEKLQRLQPLLAIAAVSDADFLIPGKHPLHRILDTLQETAVGWHPQLERAGQVVQKLLDSAVEQCLATLDNPGSGLEQVAADVTRDASRIAERAARMTLRLTEGEQGRLRSLHARQRAAAMLNPMLLRYGAPAPIAAFVRSDWYESAQLVWLKFGEGSPQWLEVKDSSEQLLQSVQAIAPGDERAREQQMQRVAVLPERLRRWTLSLANDREALEQLLQRLEFEHLRLLGQQPPELVEIPLIEAAGESGAEDADSPLPEGINEGQWYRLAEGKQPLRLRLVNRQPGNGELLFVNVAGLKARTQAVATFRALVDSGTAHELATGSSFSRCLAQAAGIDSQAALEEYGGSPEAAPAASEATPAPRQQPAARAVTEPAAPPVTPAPAAAVSSDSAQQDIAIPDLPTGTWLGFHDGETPLLAKLAMHDRQRQIYIFVNRDGVKLRQLHQTEFLQLIQQGLVDVMEQRTDFRDLVSRKQQQLRE